MEGFGPRSAPSRGEDGDDDWGRAWVVETDALNVPPHLFALMRKGPDDADASSASRISFRFVPQRGEGTRSKSGFGDSVALALLWVPAFAGMTPDLWRRMLLRSPSP